MDTEQYVFVKCKIVGKGGTNSLDNLQFLSWFENRCKNDMRQEEWDVLKSNIQEYFI